MCPETKVHLLGTLMSCLFNLCKNSTVSWSGVVASWGLFVTPGSPDCFWPRNTQTHNPALKPQHAIFALWLLYRLNKRHQIKGIAFLRVCLIQVCAKAACGDLAGDIYQSFLYPPCCPVRITGIVQLHQGDELEMVVPSMPHDLISTDEDSTFFGVVQLN